MLFTEDQSQQADVEKRNVAFNSCLKLIIIESMDMFIFDNIANYKCEEQ